MSASLTELADKATRWGQTRNIFVQQKDQLFAKLNGLEQERVTYQRAEAVLNDLLEHFSTESLRAVEEFLSVALKTIFPDQNITVKLLQEIKRDKIETRLIVDDGEGSGPPNRIAGGGPQNVIGFLIRFLIIQRYKLRPVMILDEAFRNVSEEYLENLCQFLKFLTDEYKMDILLVTHEPKFQKIAHKVYAVDKVDAHQGLKIVYEGIPSELKP